MFHLSETIRETLISGSGAGAHRGHIELPKDEIARIMGESKRITSNSKDTRPGPVRVSNLRK